jgi:hypothetical protein
MADQALSYHQAAQLKQERRRGAAQAPNQELWGDKLKALHSLGMKLFGKELKDKGDDDKDYNTAAIGHMADDDRQFLIVAVKGLQGVPDVSHIQNLASQDFGGHREMVIEVLVDATPFKGEANLHAEMAIVQEASVIGVPASSMRAFHLQIACIAKGVCPDCSGWLTRHDIPHTYRRATVAAAGWSHPITGAFFKYKGNELQYVKQVQKDVWLDTAASKTTPYPKGNVT